MTSTAPEGSCVGNSRNGRNKTLRDDTGQMEIEVPRDRIGTFEPKLVPKHTSRMPSFDEKVLSLYSRGMSTRESQGHLEELYGAEVSPALIPRVTDAVVDDVTAWQNRSLHTVSPIVYLDALVAKGRKERQVQNRALYMALGINMDGEGSAGSVDRTDRRSEVLAGSDDGTEEPCRAGHLRLLRPSTA